MTMKLHTIAFAALLIVAYCCSCANSMHQAVEPVRSSQNLTGVHRDQWYCLNPELQNSESKAVDEMSRKEECSCGQQEQAVLHLKAEIDGYSSWAKHDAVNFGADNDNLPELQRRAEAFQTRTREAAAKLQQETKKKLRKVEQRMAHLHCLGPTYCYNRALAFNLPTRAEQFATKVDACKQDPKGDNCATCNIVYKDGVLVAVGEAAIAYKKIAYKKRHRMHTLREGLKNKMAALHKLKGKHIHKPKGKHIHKPKGEHIDIDVPNLKRLLGPSVRADDSEDFACEEYVSESDCDTDTACTWKNDECDMNHEEQDDDEVEDDF